MKYQIKIKILLIIGFALLFFACAKQVAITGGPKDTTPPVMIEAEPLNGSVNFSEKTVYVRFNEFVKLNSLNQKLIVSPPIEEDPVVTIKGKGIKISIDLKLLEANTTYCLNFNDAIVYNNEGNALNSFVYAFSTGPQIDSLSFSGHVLDAFTKEPITDAWVILHDVFADSVIKTYDTAYITKVDDKGEFFIPFVRDNYYKIYALIDNNYNYLFDIPEEGIAFLDTVYHPGVETLSSTDTAGNVQNKYRNYPDNVELLIFKEKKQAQFISENKRLKPDYLEFVFNSTQYEEFSVDIPQDKNAVIYAIEQPDTVRVWLKNEDLIKSDSIAVFVDYIDPVYTDSLRSDTLVFRRSDSQERDSLIEISTPKTKEPHKPLMFVLNTPIDEMKSELISLDLKSDSTFISTDFKIVRDSLNPCHLILEAEILEKSDYRLIIQEGFVVTTSGLSNTMDTLNFSSSSTLEYGNLNLSFTDTNQNYIVQLLSGEKVVAEVNSIDGVCELRFLKPATYKIRAIKDLNNNARWDTGDFDKQIQPEPVFYYPEEYEIRANWNHELDWNPILRR
ncbi:MAG: hypothetical protein C0596_03325 [Marinilabiliales bacterium]|nr:MAG: hypothetical protein C0596_03325 [Marinilabiliales bacterium]